MRTTTVECVGARKQNHRLHAARREAWDERANFPANLPASSSVFGFWKEGAWALHSLTLRHRSWSTSLPWESIWKDRKTRLVHQSILQFISQLDLRGAA